MCTQRHTYMHTDTPRTDTRRRTHTCSSLPLLLLANRFCSFLLFAASSNQKQPRSTKATDTDTQTQRHTDTQTQAQTHTQTHTHRHGHRHTHRHTHAHTRGHTQAHTDTQTHIHTDTHRQTDRHKHRRPLSAAFCYSSTLSGSLLLFAFL